MEHLESFDFQKPSRSRYAPIVKALVDDGVSAVRIKAGEDFPADTPLDQVQGAISEQIRKRGHKARTFTEPETNSIVVALWPEGEGPRRRKATKRPAAVAA